VPPHCTLALKVIPGAGRDEIGGWHGSALKVKVRAPALDGRANDAVLGLLATRLGLPRRDLALLRGEKSRQKLIRIDNLDVASLANRLAGEPT
jgi:hypothetical protein